MIILPIGSVVSVTDVDSPVMIYGYLQKTEESSSVYDYIGCRYPVGIADDSFFLFNRDNIQKLHFVGLQDAEALEFQSAIEAFSIAEGGNKNVLDM